MIAVKTDDAIYMNVESFFAADELSIGGEGLYIETDDGSIKVMDCKYEKAKSLLDDIAIVILIHLAHSNVLIFRIKNGAVSVCNKDGLV